MITKYFEIRDRGTCIVALAIDFNKNLTDQGIKFLSRTGLLDCDSIALIKLSECEIKYDEYAWPATSRTMSIAHAYIIKNFDKLNNFDVVDVEFILGETTIKKESELGHEK